MVSFGELARARPPTCCPDQEEAAISSLLELSHHTVDDVRLGRDDVYCVHVPLRCPPLFEALNVWRGQNRSPVV
jgi:hypothetical protein